MTEALLKVENLRKGFGGVLATDNVSLAVELGQIHAVIGPNGAGKTTFINILSGTVMKSSGEVNVWGFDLDKNPRQVRASVGIVPQEVVLDPFFSPKKLLELQAGLYGIPKKDRIKNKVNAEHFAPQLDWKFLIKHYIEAHDLALEKLGV